MLALDLNRRALFAGMATATAIAAAPTLASVATLPTDTAWEYALANYQRAIAEAEQYWMDAYKHHLDRTQAMIGERPPLFFEHTAKNGHVARYQVDPKIGANAYTLPVFNRLHAEAAERFNTWHARAMQIEDEPVWASVAQRMDALWDAEEAARDDLMACPAPDAAALAYKVLLAVGLEEISVRDHDALRADAKRLANG